MATILYGKPLADEIVKTIDRQVKDLAMKRIVPQMAVIMVGGNPASQTYVNLKKQQAESLGMKVTIKVLPDKVSEAQLIALVLSINQDPSIHGILVQMPLPAHINQEKIVWAIAAAKDIDGFQMHEFLPPAPMAIIELLQFYGFVVTRKKVLIIGQGFLIGKPLSILMRRFGAKVTEADEQTRFLERRAQEAEIIVSATGKAEIVKGSMVKEGQIVVDAGGEWVMEKSEIRNPKSEKKMKFVGEVVREEIEPIVKALVPNPGGIGPVTVALLLRNTVLAAKRSSNTR